MFDDLDPLEAGAAYALFRHGQDAQTEELTDALRHLDTGEPQEVHVHVHDAEPIIQPVNALDFSTADMPRDWDGYIGQEPLKRQLQVHMAAAKAQGRRMPHTLLASGYPGVGKTTMARLIAKTMGVDIYELVPPFSIETIVMAAEKLGDGDVLFIDEIHLLKRGSEILLKVLEEGWAPMPDGEPVQLPNITIIAATTDPDLLPQTILDRFKIKPYFQKYNLSELARIVVKFAFRHDAEEYVDDDLAVAIGKACRGTPRISEEMVEAALALGVAMGREPTAEELLEFVEVEPDGLTRTHIHYITALRQYFGREAKDGGVEYIVGEAAIMQILRETKPGIQRIEAFLVERGLIDRTPRGRRLTPRGIHRAEEFIRQGKGASNVA